MLKYFCLTKKIIITYNKNILLWYYVSLKVKSASFFLIVPLTKINRLEVRHKRQFYWMIFNFVNLMMIFKIFDCYTMDRLVFAWRYQGSWVRTPNGSRICSSLDTSIRCFMKRTRQWSLQKCPKIGLYLAKHKTSLC